MIKRKIKYVFKNIFDKPKLNKPKLREPDSVLSILADIKKPPWGGANQFFIALINQLGKNNIEVKNNYIGNETSNYLLNSIYFDLTKLENE